MSLPDILGLCLSKRVKFDFLFYIYCKLTSIYQVLKMNRVQKAYKYKIICYYIISNFLYE